MSSRDKSDHLDEFSIIAEIFAPLSRNHSGAFNLTDDCASYTPEPGYDLVLTKDTIVSGIHFFPDNPPASIAIKALAVNLSDLASKGAVPDVYLLSISLPSDINTEWLKQFSSGLKGMQERYNISLIGGDTVSTTGPLTVSVTMMGYTPSERMVRRSTAKAGNILYVSGTIGDSWTGLQLLLQDKESYSQYLNDDQSEFLKDRYLHPQPRLELREAIYSYASAAMDISDGLGIDLRKLCQASDVGADLYINKIPLSDANKSLLQDKQELLEAFINGGDDYEILATVSESNAGKFEEELKNSQVPVQAIGRIIDGKNTINCYSETGDPVELKLSGYNHFK